METITLTSDFIAGRFFRFSERAAAELRCGLPDPAGV